MNGKQNWKKDILRTVVAAFDWIAFLLLKWMYQIFFDVSTVEFFSNKTVSDLFVRVQEILGIFIVFKVTISVIQALADPDRVYDNKNGFSKLFVRILVCLAMLTMIMPTNIRNPKNDFQKKVNNNGVLFGTLYSLQKRVLDNNTLGRLILGSTAKTAQEQNKNTKSISNEFIATILEGIVQVRDKDGCPTTIYENAANDNDIVNHVFMDNINNECSDKNYMFTYYPFVGLIVAIGFTVILAIFTIDIAVRAIKLGILRLVAPIPIISYLDPNQAQKGAFASWVKALVATYLDLFLRLAIIYFVFFLIKDIMENGLIGNFDDYDAFSKVLVFVIICFGMFLFAKMAPKFIKDVLGLEGIMQNIGLASVLAGAGTIAAGGGFLKAASNSYQAATEATRASVAGGKGPGGKGGPSFEENYAKYRDGTLAQITGDKNRRGGIGGNVDHWTDKAMAKRYGVDEDNIKEAKSLTKSEEAKLANLTHLYDKSKANTDALRNLNTTSQLSNYVNDDGSWKSEDARQIAYKKFEDLAKSHDKFLESSNETEQLYNGVTAQTKQVEDYKKNLEDMKDAAKTFYGKEKPYTARKPATPTPGNDSASGSGGTMWSSAGVNSNGPGGPRR